MAEETSKNVLTQVEFSTEEDDEMGLNQSVVTSGAELELKPKEDSNTEIAKPEDREDSDKEIAKQEEKVEKSESQSGTNGKTDSEFELDCQKDITVAVSLNLSAEGLTEAGNNKPENDSVGTLESLDSEIGSESGYYRPDFAGASERLRPTCAVCKYLHKKCVPDCLVAPYFPAHKEADFLKVQKLFGVKKLTRTLEKAETASKRKIASESMIFEANMRAEDPAGGCCRYIQNIECEIKKERTELERVLHQLELYRNCSPLVKDESQDDLVANQMEDSVSKSPEESVQDSPAKRQKRGL